MSNKEKYPDAYLHKVVSFIKSGVRIAACVVGVTYSYEIGFFGLAIAELIGIYEELV